MKKQLEKGLEVSSKRTNFLNNKLDLIKFNTISSIFFLTVSFLHTNHIISKSSFFEANPINGFLLSINPLLSYFFSISIPVLLVYVSLKYFKKIHALTISGFFFGFTFFDFYSHILIILN